MTKRDANEMHMNEGPDVLREWLEDEPPIEWEDTDTHSDSENSAELQLDTICLREFANLKLPPRNTVLEPILPERGLAMLFAGRGIGKTRVALGIAYAVSTGGD